MQHVPADVDKGDRLRELQGVFGRPRSPLRDEGRGMGKRQGIRHYLDNDNFGRVGEDQVIDAVMGVPDNGPLLDDGAMREG